MQQNVVAESTKKKKKKIILHYEQKWLHEIRVNESFGCSVIKTLWLKVPGFRTLGQLTPVLPEK